MKKDFNIGGKLFAVDLPKGFKIEYDTEDDTIDIQHEDMEKLDITICIVDEDYRSNMFEEVLNSDDPLILNPQQYEVPCNPKATFLHFEQFLFLASLYTLRLYYKLDDSNYVEMSMVIMDPSDDEDQTRILLEEAYSKLLCVINNCNVDSETLFIDNIDENELFEIFS